MPSLIYILSIFPSTSATFELNELLELNKKGFDITIISLNKPLNELYKKEADVFKNLIYIPHGKEGIISIVKLIQSNIRYFINNPIKYTNCFIDVLKKGSIKLIHDFCRAVYINENVKIHVEDHIHAHFVLSPTNIAYFLNILSGRKYSFTCHAVDIFVKSNRILFEQQLKSAVFAVTISRFNMRFLKETLNDKKLIKKMEVIRCGINYEKFKIEKVEKIENIFNIFSVGRLVEKKGYIYLLEALKIIKEKQLLFNCNIIGDGPLYKDLKNKIIEYNLQDEVHLLGAQNSDTIRIQLNNANVFVLPCIISSDGDMDGIPVALMEAMAYEIPVISSKISGIPELIDDGVNGLLVEEKSIVGIQKSVEHLMKNPEICVSFGKNARNKIINEFGLSENVQILADKFHTILNI